MHLRSFWFGQRWIRNLFIQVESTPNEHALKFLPGMSVSGSSAIEFLDKGQAEKKSSLATKLFEIKGIRSVFFGRDFISVNKQEKSEWKHLKPQVLAAITEHVTAKESFLLEKEEEKKELGALPPTDADPDVVKQIIKILDTKVRPAVQGDGGDVEYRGFMNGWVKLRLQGACRSCASSVVTLRNGIENMLMYYVPQVKGVEQVEDELDATSEEEFERVEKEIKEKHQ